MNLGQYQNLAIRTANSDLTYREKVSNFAMGLAGEAGETVDYLKKCLYHGHYMDVDVVEKELGDVLWYVAVLADTIGLDLEDIAEKNIAKLKARYPDGFSKAKSINREE